MANARTCRPEIIESQAALRRIAAKGRYRLNREGKTDAEIDAEIAKAVRKIGPRPEDKS